PGAPTIVNGLYNKNTCLPGLLAVAATSPTFNKDIYSQKALVSHRNFMKQSQKPKASSPVGNG
ncbi:MAG: hypothetical protein NZ703_14570, partial [Gemmataceae bacterium]|nr:hypothetical protein [Gemmataceae bacterium]